MSAVEWRASLISGDATTEMSAEPTLKLRFRPKAAVDTLEFISRKRTLKSVNQDDLRHEI
jgi:hypothetical protein